MKEDSGILKRICDGNCRHICRYVHRSILKQFAVYLLLVLVEYCISRTGIEINNNAYPVV